MRQCSACGKPNKIWAVGVDCEPPVQVCVKCVRDNLPDESGVREIYKSKIDNYYAVRISMPLKVSEDNALYGDDRGN